MLDLQRVGFAYQFGDRPLNRGLRADLYDRLQRLPLRVPPLRERSEDMPLLAAHFLRTAPMAR